MEYTIYLTDDCNLQCTYCYEGENKNKGYLNDYNLRKTISFIISNVEPDDTIFLTFLGGEPLLNYKKLFDMIDYINKNHSEYSHQFKYDTTTNAILLNKELIDKLIDHNITISISIDGSEETNNINRKSKNGVNYYSTIINNIKYFLDKNYNFTARMTVNPNTIRFCYENVLYFYKMGIKKFNISMNPFAKWSESDFEIMEEQFEYLDKFYIDKELIDKELYLDIYDGKFLDFIVGKPQLYCCAGSKGNLTINSSGEIYPCGFVSNNKQWCIGTVETGLDRKKFFSQVKSNVKKVSKCRSCYLSFTCQGAKCGFKNFCLSGYLNEPSEELCKLEKILYKHNVKVIKHLYKINSRRIINLLETNKKNGRISSIMEEIIQN